MPFASRIAAERSEASFALRRRAKDASDRSAATSAFLLLQTALDRGGLPRNDNTSTRRHPSHTQRSLGHAPLAALPPGPRTVRYRVRRLGKAGERPKLVHVHPEESGPVRARTSLSRARHR